MSKRKKATKPKHRATLVARLEECDLVEYTDHQGKVRLGRLVYSDALYGAKLVFDELTGGFFRVSPGDLTVIEAYGEGV